MVNLWVSLKPGLFSSKFTTGSSLNSQLSLIKRKSALLTWYATKCLSVLIVWYVGNNVPFLRFLTLFTYRNSVIILGNVVLNHFTNSMVFALRSWCVTSIGLNPVKGSWGIIKCKTSPSGRTRMGKSSLFTLGSLTSSFVHVKSQKVVDSLCQIAKRNE